MWKYAIWWVQWLSEFKYLVNITWTDMGGTHKSRHTGMAAQWVTFCTKNSLDMGSILGAFWSKKILKIGSHFTKIAKNFSRFSGWKTPGNGFRFVKSQICCFLREKNQMWWRFSDFGLHTLSKSNPCQPPGGGGTDQRDLFLHCAIYTRGLSLPSFMAIWLWLGKPSLAKWTVIILRFLLREIFALYSSGCQINR